MQSCALIPTFLTQKSSFLWELLFLLLGISVLALLAQVKITVPWSVVPITGQTFGVASIALLWGCKRSAFVVFGYLVFGALGAPIFAASASGLSWGPTLGYLIGMQLSALVVGFWADRGFARRFGRALFACYCGSALVFTCGLTVLSFFVPKESLLLMGFYPFLLGDLIKNTLASGVAVGLYQCTRRT